MGAGLVLTSSFFASVSSSSAFGAATTGAFTVVFAISWALEAEVARVFIAENAVIKARTESV